jgi:hypothetical protein
MPEIAYQSDPDEGAAKSSTTDEKSNTDLLKKLKGWWKLDSEHWEPWRKQAFEDFAFVAGDQYTDEETRYLKEQLRPVITFNRVDPIIRSVSGEQINNAQQVQYLPREEGDTRPNEVLTSAADWFRDQCDADDEESEAFWDAAVCGMGVTDTLLEMEDDPEEPTPVIERKDPLCIIPDKSASKRNFKDARRIFEVRADIPIEDARDMFPDADDADLDASWARLDDFGSTSDADEAREYEGDNLDTGPSGEKSTVTIVQCQWWEKKTFYKTLNPETGEAVTVDAATNAKLQKAAKKVGLPIPSVKLQKRVFKRAFIGRTILKVADSPCPDRFTFNFITGFRDRNQGHFYGLVRGMKDPQRWANKWLSQTLHIMNANAKGGIMMETGAVEDVRKFEDSYNDHTKITFVPDGTLASPNGPRFVAKPMPTFPVGFYQLMEFAISSIRDTQGINLEMMGMREADQPASLEYQRRQAGVTILAPLFRSMRRYHRNEGQVMLYYIQNLLSDQTLVRIIGDGEFGGEPEQMPQGMPGMPGFQPGQPGKPPVPEGEKRYVRLGEIKAARSSSAKYDIVVDEGPTSPNQKERVWGLIGPHFFSGAIPPEVQMALIDYAPLPTSVIEAVKKASAKASEGPAAKMQEQMQQLGAMLAEAKVLLTKAQAEKAQADAQESMADAALKGSQVGQPVGRDGIADKGPETMLKAAELQQKGQIEREKIASKERTDAAWMMNDRAMAAGKADTDMQREMAGKAVEALLRPEPKPPVKQGAQ